MAKVNLIGLSLMIMIFITILGVLMGAEFGEVFASTNQLAPGSTIIYEATNGTIVNTSKGRTFGIDDLAGAIIILVAVIGIVALIGVQVLGSGLSSESVKIIAKCIVYGAIWGVFTILTSVVIFAIPTFGALIYISLTIMYVIGVIQQIGGT